MNRTHVFLSRAFWVSVALAAVQSAAAANLRYTASLQDADRPAEGSYDLRIDTYADEHSTSTPTTTYLFEDVAVSNGRVELDLDATGATGATGAAAPVWVALSVRDGDQSGAYLAIPGRQEAIAPSVIGQCWSSSGDSGSDPDTHFLGTVEDTDLVLRTANVQSLRIEPSVLAAPTPLVITASMIGGSSANAAVNGVRGVSIGGGGSVPHPSNPDGTFFSIAPNGNRAFSPYATIAGGYANSAGTDGANGTFAAVGGGAGSRATGGSSVVIGGFSNVAAGFGSTASGGSFNCAGGDSSWAGGRSAKVRPGNQPGDGDCAANSGDGNGDEGSFVWADSNTSDFVSNGANRVLMRATGGLVMQAKIGSETIARAPRGYFNVVRGDSGTAQPASASTAIMASFENDSDAFLSVLSPTGFNRGIVFADPASSNRGGMVYSGIDDSLQFLANGSTRMLLRGDGRMFLPVLASAGSTALCRNAASEISTCSSSLRYKQDIRPLDLGLDTVQALRAVQYLWTADGQADVGFVAEEVAALDERLITRNESGAVEGVKYDRISAVLASAVQTLAEREKAQRREIEDLNARLARLETLLSAH